MNGAALFIGGAMVGAAAALLLTTDKGGQLCEQIKDLAKEAKQRAQACCEAKSCDEAKPEDTKPKEEA